jgi:hypothetical protein
MTFWTRLLKRSFRREGIRMAPPRRRRPPQLMLEHLETRIALATLMVNSLADAVSGTAATLDLREAILLVNSGGTATDTSFISLSTAKGSQIDGGQPLTTNPFGSNDTIQFDPSLAGQTITLGSVLPVLLSNVAIIGLGANTPAISGPGLDQVFNVGTGVTASISGLIIENGTSGISSAGTLTVGNCTFTQNRAGIVNNGTATVVSSTITGNAQNGIVNNGTATVVNSTLSNDGFVYTPPPYPYRCFGGPCPPYPGTIFLNTAAVSTMAGH